MDILHDDADEIAGLDERVHRNDVRVAQTRRHARLAAEAFAMVFRAGEIVFQNLDGDQAVERNVASEKHHAHRAFAQLTHDLIVVAEMNADLPELPGAGDGWRLVRGFGLRYCLRHGFATCFFPSDTNSRRSVCCVRALGCHVRISRLESYLCGLSRFCEMPVSVR